FRLPVKGRNIFCCPRGVKGAILPASKPRMMGDSVSRGPISWLKPGPAQTPVKSGLPSLVRGMDLRGGTVDRLKSGGDTINESKNSDSGSPFAFSVLS